MSLFNLLLIRAVLLWLAVSLHVVGGAAVFRRFFPKESPWFGFLVPALALVILMNFVERLVAVPSLVWLMPFTTVGFIWAMVHPKVNWKGLRLPAGIFLASFAFTLSLRALRPDLPSLRDGTPDLGMMSSFCMGEKVPPRMSWYPDLPLIHYYAFGHYGMSVLTRLFGLDVGTGFNLSSALLSAFDLLLVAGAAWRISRQKLWITILAPLLFAGAENGATVYLWFTIKGLNPADADDLLFILKDAGQHNPLSKLLHDSGHNELVPPGAWSWIGSFHSTCGGLFLVLFFVWNLLELLRARTTNWPWICAGAIPLLTIPTSTWALPLEGLLLLGAIFWIWYYKLVPQNFRFVLFALGLVASLLLPVLLEFSSTSSPGGNLVDPNDRTQLVEFLVLWWPVLLPLLFLVFRWHRLSPGLKTILCVLPLAYLGVEFYTVANRYDWTEKLWCYIFGVAWITLVPAVLVRRSIPFRLLSLVLIVSSLCSFWIWGSFLWTSTAWGFGDFLHLEGTGCYRWDPTRAKLLQTLSRIKGATILTGKDGGLYEDAPPMAAFTGNRIYITWWYFVDVIENGSTTDLAQRRAKEVNDFYDGKCINPLLFLRTRDISAVVIWPGDKIETKLVDKLKEALVPYSEYVDLHDDQANSGVFLFHPNILNGVPEQALISPETLLNSTAIQTLPKGPERRVRPAASLEKRE